MTYEYNSQGDIVGEFDGEPTPDDKGRPMPYHMSDRQIQEELLLNSRKVADLVNGFFQDLQSGKLNPMKMMMGGFRK